MNGCVIFCHWCFLPLPDGKKHPLQQYKTDTPPSLSLPPFLISLYWSADQLGSHPVLLNSHGGESLKICIWKRGNIFCTNVELFKSIEIQLTADLFTGVHRCLTSPLHRLVYKFFQSHFNSCMIVRGLHWETAVLMHCCDPECLKLWKLQSTFASSGCSVSGEKSSVEVGSRG